MQVCILLQTDNHASTPPLSFFTGRMPFLPPNQQHQSTVGLKPDLPDLFLSPWFVQFVHLLCMEIDLRYKELWHFFAKIPATQSEFLSQLVECMSNIGGGAGGAQAPQWRGWGTMHSPPNSDTSGP